MKRLADFEHGAFARLPGERQPAVHVLRVKPPRGLEVLDVEDESNEAWQRAQLFDEGQRVGLELSSVEARQP